MPHGLAEEFVFKRRYDALRRSVISAVAGPADTLRHLLYRERAAVLATRVLTAVIRVLHETGRRPQPSI
jgi:hypothetical protein